MKKIFYPIIFLLSLLFTFSCGKIEKKVNELKGTIALLEQKNKELDKENRDAKKFIDEIQILISEIKNEEGYLLINPNYGDDIKPSQVAEDFNKIANILKEKKESIRRLQNELKSSKEESTGLKEKIETLIIKIQGKDEEIAKLKEEIEVRDNQIEELEISIDTLTKKMDEISLLLTNSEETQNLVYYAIGSLAELREQNIVGRRGRDLLEIEFNKDYFSAIDLRNTTSLPLYAKKADLLTSHPHSSYSLDKDEDGLLSLNILDINIFWSTSKYLVIEVER